MKLIPLLGLIPLTLGGVLCFVLPVPFLIWVNIGVGVVILADLPKPPPIK